jgi:hypothetical protein
MFVKIKYFCGNENNHIIKDMKQNIESKTNYDICVCVCVIKSIKYLLETNVNVLALNKKQFDHLCVYIDILLIYIIILCKNKLFI